MGPPNPAQTPAIILGVCALLMAIGVFTKSWVSHSERGADAGIGLLGLKVCGGGQCASFGWSEGFMKKADGDIKAFGYLGFITGLAAIGAAGYCAFLAFQRQSHKIPVKIINGVFGAAAFCFTFFLVRLMTSEIGDEAGPSYSGFLAIGGVVGAGFVLKQMLGPIIAQGPGAAVAAAPGGGYQAQPGGMPANVAAVTCPRCQGQAQYVAQYQRHFCNACQQYV
jgi:hypothetical protein